LEVLLKRQKKIRKTMLSKLQQSSQENYVLLFFSVYFSYWQLSFLDVHVHLM